MESNQKNIYAEIGREINEGLDVSGKTLEDRLKHLMTAQEMILNQDDTSILDNFLDEMLQFMHQKDQKIRCFVISFIEKACKKDPEVMKKAISTLSWPMSESGMLIAVQKKVINACTQLYPVILKWVVQRRNDKEVEQCWNIFCQLKGRIMQTLDSDNEGIRFMAFKFLETIILCQTSRTELSESVNTPYQMSLDEISRDHSFISYRMLASEAAHGFDCLLQQLASSHISSLNLVTVISCLCTVAKQRPEYFPQVVSALESLHVNLPPTLGTSQVKSVRKELKMHLLRMLKHPASLSHLHRITQLLVELGASQSEISKATPATSEVKEMLKKKVAEAKEAALRNSSSNMGLPRSRPAEDALDTDLRDPKRLKLDDDEYEDSGDIFKQLDDIESASHATQKAVEITTNFVLERLTNAVVTKLVILCLAQKRHLSRMLAIQLTKEGEGPGIQYIKEEKQKLFVARQFARSEGAVIPPTPYNDRSQNAIGAGKNDINKFMQPQMLSTMKSKARLQNFNLFSITRELLPQEAESMFVHAFQRIMNNEKRAVQGGAGLAQQKILVRLVTRFHSIRTKELEAMLLNFIVNDQKNRTDLALLWLAELYAQLQGYSICMSSFSPGNFFSDEDRYVRYDTVLCSFLSTLHDRGEHKETLFHRIFLEVPLITSSALSILRMACIDKVYGAFGMTTLRELILTRARQRRELLKLLLEFSYFERNDIKEHCVRTAKELYQIDYIRDDVREFVIQMSENLVQPTAPKVIWHKTGRMDKATEESITEMPWDESLIRAGLHLFLSLLAIDHSLLHQLASVCARANTEIKRVTFRNIEQAIKSTGMNSEALLSMIAECPEGSETLIARVVHLLTERNPPTVELVERVRNLHLARNTDVRSLIPIMTGLEKKELLDLIPKFVISATNGKSVPAFFKKLIFGRHLDLLMVDHAKEFNLNKEVFANSIEHLIENVPLPSLLFHSLQKVHENYPALNGFLSNVFVKLAQKKIWTDNPELWTAFLKCARAVKSVAFMAVVTQLTIEEFKEYAEYVQPTQPDLLTVLRKFVSSLNAHQQNLISRPVLEHISANEGQKKA